MQGLTCKSHRGSVWLSFGVAGGRNQRGTPSIPHEIRGVWVNPWGAPRGYRPVLAQIQKMNIQTIVPQKLRRKTKRKTSSPQGKDFGECELSDNSALYPWIIFSFCSMLCSCKGGASMAKNEPMAKEIFVNGQMGGGKDGILPAMIRRLESGSSRMCWEKPRRKSRPN